VTYIVNHAEDSVIFVDDSLVPVLEKLAPSFSTVERYVVMGDGDTGTLPNALRYEELLDAAGPGDFDYPDLDERQAAALCYTSGTTGNPKGVLYSHRSISLHSTGTLMTDSTALSRADRVLAVVPDVPRERLGPSLRRRARRSRPHPAGPLPRRRAAREVDRRTSVPP